MKRLLPSLRAKKRYLAFELVSEGQVSRSDLVKEVMSSATLTRVGGKRATLHVLGTSGTVKKATEKFLQNHTVFKPEIRMKSRRVEE